MSSEAAQKVVPVPSELKTYQHLQTYPIAVSWLRIIHSVPLPHVVRPYLYQLAFSGPARGVTESVDTFFDETVLGTFETVVPAAKTLRMRDIRDALTTPVTNALTRLLRERAEPLVKPLNDNFIRAVNSAYPDDPVVDAGDAVGLPATVAILQAGATRTGPVIERQYKMLRELPQDVQKKVADLYETNIKRRSDTRTDGAAQNDGRVVVLIAVLDTARDLAHESYDLVFNQTASIMDNEVAPEH